MECLVLEVILIVLVNDVLSLKNVFLSMPKAVPDGAIVTMGCLFDLEGAKLQSVKWYRGNMEFYRFQPRDIPPIRIFPLPGLYIDHLNSNEHQVTIVDIPLILGGKFSCEVTTDDPHITSKIVEGFLEVYTKPTEENGDVHFEFNANNFSQEIIENSYDMEDYSNFGVGHKNSFILIENMLIMYIGLLNVC